MRLGRERLLVHALVAGILGYAAIVAFFAIANVLAGRSPFFTAAVLGNALLGDPSTAVSARSVAVYNGLHLVAFLLLGAVAAWISDLVERRPELWYLFLVFGIVVFFHLFGAVATLAAPVGDAVPLWQILCGSLLALAAMSAWLGRAYPGIAAGVRAVGDLEDARPR